MIGRSPLGHQTDHFALERRHILHIGTRIQRKTIGRYAGRDINQLGATQHCVDHGAAGGGHIDVSGYHGLSQPSAPGNINILEVETIFLIEPRFVDHP